MSMGGFFYGPMGVRPGMGLEAVKNPRVPLKRGQSRPWNPFPASHFPIQFPVWEINRVLARLSFIK